MDNNTLIIIALAVAIVVLPKVLGAIRQINPVKAKELVDNGATVIDVRNPDEYRTGHIKKALNFPVSSIESKIKKSVPDKTTQLVVYCQSGSRSHMACNTLKRLGYINVNDLGGINRWKYGTSK